jgi:hypothetical protein
MDDLHKFEVLNNLEEMSCKHNCRSVAFILGYSLLKQIACFAEDTKHTGVPSI